MTLGSLDTPDEKVAAAKALLLAATRQRRREYQAEVAAHRCKCGHRRDEHSETYSINYTEGFCGHHGCECRWFNYVAEDRPKGRDDEI